MTAVLERNSLLLAPDPEIVRDSPPVSTEVSRTRQAVSGQPLVDIAGLHIGFRHANGGAPVVRGIDLCLRAGECVALVGESGSGKSLTARSLLGLAGQHAQVSASHFRINGRDALKFDESEWRALRGTFAGLVM